MGVCYSHNILYVNMFVGVVIKKVNDMPMKKTTKNEGDDDNSRVDNKKKVLLV